MNKLDYQFLDFWIMNKLDHKLDYQFSDFWIMNKLDYQFLDFWIMIKKDSMPWNFELWRKKMNNKRIEKRIKRKEWEE